MLTPEHLVLAALVVCLVLSCLLPFLTAPVRMKFRSWQAADPTYTDDDDSQLPSRARVAAKELEALGFENLGTWRHDGSARATGWVILMHHPRTLDVAHVMVVAAGNRRTVSLMMLTQFADGTEAATFNSPVVVGFPSPLGLTGAWLPEVRSAAALYRIHVQLRDALRGAGGCGAWVGPDPAEFLRNRSARMLAAWVEGGYYAVDEEQGRVRPTWKGAVLITWRLLWPVKPLYRAGRRRATRRLLERLGVCLDQ
jgi:hypothetical protein